MKAILTGASSEVGKSLMQNFDYDWVCFDRTHGYTLPDDIEKFKKELDTSSLFLNVASFGTIQSDLLALTWNYWNNQHPRKSKKIISFGSLVTEIDMPTILEMNDCIYFNRLREKSDYIGEKLLLNKTHTEYKDLHLKGYMKDYCLPQSILIKFGNILYREIRSHEPYTNVEQMVEVVNYAINSKSYISDLEVRWN